MFSTVLVANRGEIALRVMRTLRRMSIRSVAVYSDADATAPFVKYADIAVHIGPAPAVDSYLRIDRIIEAAERTGAEAIHPGYGFLSENVEFAAACERAGIAFIGPPVSAMEAMADKIRAKQTAVRAGVPVVPGSHNEGMDDAAVAAAIAAIGFPALLKPSAGGGGKGMRVITENDDIAEQIAAARREARASFGDDSLLVERFVTTPRHIEVQILADTHGTVLHLGERECSLQRRHQKVVEEAPSPLLDAATREAICSSAVRLAAAVGYVGAGTVEYVVPSANPGEFAFLEMNTRLQVEHPVTELVTGVDLVEQQIRIAAGEPLALAQSDITLRGHAVEARVYAEDPERGFLPTGGTILHWATPDDVRVDSGIETGSQIGSSYDPMLAKVIAWAPDRTEALARLGTALGQSVCLGVTTNISFVRQVLAEPAVVAGDIDTGLLGRLEITAPDLTDAITAAVLTAQVHHLDTAGGVWRGAWRVAGSASTRWTVTTSGSTADVTISGDPTACTVTVGDDVRPVHWIANGDGAALTTGELTVDVVTTIVHAPGQGQDTHTIWTHTAATGGRMHTVAHPRDLRVRGGQDAGHGAGPWVARSPMPGAVVTVATVGQEVAAGEPVVAVEAMKMEHALRAPAAGVVLEVRVAVGQQVRLDEELVVVEIRESE